MNKDLKGFQKNYSINKMSYLDFMNKTHVKPTVYTCETYDTYTFTEVGGHIEYLQVFAAEDNKLPGVTQGETIYLVTQYEGFFSNKADANSDPLPASLGVTMPAAPADDAAADDAAEA